MLARRIRFSATFTAILVAVALGACQAGGPSSTGGQPSTQPTNGLQTSSPAGPPETAVQSPSETQGSAVGVATDIAAGSQHSCAVVSASVWCWGTNGQGALGDGIDAGNSTVPVRAVGIDDAVDVAAGGLHSCAVQALGTVMCWGSNLSGELGDPANAALPPADRGSAVPLLVEGLSDAVAVSAGNAHTCAVRQDGSVVCWGRNAVGQLGDGTMVDKHAPAPVAGVSDAVGVSAGGEHTCAVLTDGTIMCWGRGAQGQLGTIGLAVSASPVAATGISDAVAVAAGTSHTCALLGSGGVTCWGTSDQGQLGTGAFSNSAALPAAVSKLADATAIAVGEKHSCAARASGEIVCWGLAFDGQLGTSEKAPSPVPVTVSNLLDATQVATGVAHSCAVLESGSITCWGSNLAGQLGDGSQNSSADPVPVSGP